ncbi:MAG: DNA translocase FtsK [Planctomycetota bacterium]|nr:DNA translocase FtsK [Planctomycetota bacterium]MDA1140009.1 DNA translocase FtsK [Planctomycetota bacterium]
MSHEETETTSSEGKESFKAIVWMPAILGICISLFCLLSLVSFSPADYPEWQRPSNELPSNWCGKAGAFIAIRLFHLFGLGSYFILATVAGWALRMSIGGKVEDPWQRVGGSVLMVVCMCAAMQLLPGQAVSASTPGNGGILGITLVHLLGAYFGAVGKVLVIMSLLTLSSLLATNELLFQSLGLIQKVAGRIHIPSSQPQMAIASTSSGEAILANETEAPELAQPRSRGRHGHAEARPEQPRNGKLGSVPNSNRRRTAPPTRKLFGLLADRHQAECEAVAPPNVSWKGNQPPIVEGIPLEESDFQALEEKGKREEFESELKKATPKPQPAQGVHRAPERSRPRQEAQRPDPIESYEIPSDFDQASITEPDYRHAPPAFKKTPAREEQNQPPQSLEDDFDERTYALTQNDIHTQLELPARNAEENVREAETTRDSTNLDLDESRSKVGLEEDAETTPLPNVAEAAAPEPDAEYENSGIDEVTVDDLVEGGKDSIFQAEDDTPEGAFLEKEESSDSKSVEHRIESLRNQSPPPPVRRQALPKPRKGKYHLPPLDLLDISKQPRGRELESRQKVKQLETALADFKVGAEVVDIQRGPTVTMFELALAPGVKLNKIVTLSDDLAIAMRAMSVRVVAPIPGKSTVGLEIPNEVKEAVRMRELIEAYGDQDDMVLPLFLGKDVSGKPVVSDLAAMPHLLIAGSTGSGKSVCINSLIASILLKRTPDEVRLVLIDPKMVELSGFEDIPHLLSPVVTDMKKAPSVLEWAVKKMDQRYDLLASVGVRHIKQFNELGEDRIKSRLLNRGALLEDVPYHLPYIVVVVDEYADLMMVASKDVEKSITRLAQKSRAVGIHVILATQRPSVDVITGLIKSNMTTRIGFRVSSKVDSRTILDRNGAEKLVGMGDMLFLPPGKSDLIRSQGSFLSDGELSSIVEFIKAQDNPTYEPELEDIEDLDGGGEDFANRDKLYDQAVRIVLQEGRGSVSLLQRKLEIGYTRAARLMDFMAKDGIVGGYKGSKAREVQMSLDEWEEIRRSAE